jgi:hypothetical protein
VHRDNAGLASRRRRLFSPGLTTGPPTMVVAAKLVRAEEDLIGGVASGCEVAVVDVCIVVRVAVFRGGVVRVVVGAAVIGDAVGVVGFVVGNVSIGVIINTDCEVAVVDVRVVVAVASGVVRVAVFCGGAVRVVVGAAVIGDAVGVGGTATVGVVTGAAIFVVEASSTVVVAAADLAVVAVCASVQTQFRNKRHASFVDAMQTEHCVSATNNEKTTIIREKKPKVV